MLMFMSEILHTPEQPPDTLVERIKLKKQYDVWTHALEQSGVLTLFTDIGNEGVGIVDVRKNRRDLPTYKTIETEMLNNKEALSLAIEQGFTQLEIVPITMDREVLISRTHDEILRASVRGPVYSPGNRTTPRTRL